MHTLSAFYLNDGASGAADVLLPAIQDQCFTTRDSRLFPPENRMLMQGYAAGASLTLAKLDSATLLLNGRPILYPVASVAPGGSLPAYIDYRDRGLTLPKMEAVGILFSRAVAAAADVFGFLWHTDRFMPATPGPTKTVRATAAITIAEGVWALGNLVFDTALSDGIYEVVGMAVFGTGVIAARLAFSGQVNRPGCLGVALVASYVYPNWRMGASGRYGQFRNYNPPQLEVFGTAAGTAQEVYLDLVKVA